MCKCTHSKKIQRKACEKNKDKKIKKSKDEIRSKKLDSISTIVWRAKINITYKNRSHSYKNFYYYKPINKGSKKKKGKPKM